MKIRVLTVATCLLLPRVIAAQLVGAEFQVNTYTGSGQNFAAVASAADGAFVVVWSSNGEDGYSYGTFGQRYDSAGQKVGTEFQVNGYTLGTERLPDIAVAPDGSFVVVWESYRGTSGYEIFARRYDSTGAAAGTEFQVNTFTLGYQNLAAVAAAGDGAFTVVWESQAEDGDQSGIFAQRFDSAGQGAGTEFQVNEFTASYQFFPDVAMNAGGAFIVTWDSGLEDGDSRGVFARRYDSAGQAEGGEFQINSHTNGVQLEPAVAMGVDGSFVVAWGSYRDGDISGVFARRFDNAGAPEGAEFQVNSFTLSFQNSPAVVVATDDSFVVAWQGYQNGTKTDVLGRFYDSTGQSIGGELQINTYTSDIQSSPAVAPAVGGAFTVVWRSRGEDGDYNGIFGQRIAPTPAPTPQTQTDCPAVPAGTCAASLKAQLQLKLGADDTKDKLKWKFTGGPLLTQSDFGDPTVAASYALCLYDDGALEVELQIGPSNILWSPVSSKGYQYKDAGGSADGVTKMKLLGGAAGKSKLQVKGKGTNLPMPTPVSGTRFFAQTTAVIAQLRELNGDCYEASFTDADTSKNDGVQYKAKK